MQIQQNLRQLRLNAGLTQQQAADQIGLTRQTLSGYESGRTRPDLDTLLLLCSIYNADFNDVLYGSDRKLQQARRIRRAALLLAAILVLLTAVSAGISLYRGIFMLKNGLAPENGGTPIPYDWALMTRLQQLGNLWITADRIILALTTVGFAALIICSLVFRVRIPLKEKLLYLSGTAVCIVLVSLLGLFDPIFPVVNYLITPSFVVLRAALLLAAGCLSEAIRK